MVWYLYLSEPPPSSLDLLVASEAALVSGAVSKFPLQPARQISKQVTAVIHTALFKHSTILSVCSGYSIKKTRPHKKSRFVHQILPEGFKSYLEAAAFAAAKKRTTVFDGCGE